MATTAGLLATLLIAFVAAAGAQGVQYIDVTSAPQRTKIRRPPPPPELSNGLTGGYGSSLIVECGGADVRDLHSVAVYLDGVDGEEINPAGHFRLSLGSSIPDGSRSIFRFLLISQTCSQQIPPSHSRI